jgi:outer membrane protein OmpA-like peptidoglycan-associated protein
MQTSFRLTAISCAFLTASGCSTTQYQDMKNSVNEFGSEYGTVALCGLGAVAGAVIGVATADDKADSSERLRRGTVGGLAGGAIGCAIGNYWQSRLQDLERIAKEENLKIKTEQLTAATSTEGSSVVVTAVPKNAGLVTLIEDSGMFAHDSDQLSESGKRAVQKLAQMYVTPSTTDQAAAAQTLQERRLLVVGHSDASGAADYNQKLSEHRAKTVGKVLVAAGIPAKSIYYQGAGASRPIAENSDPLMRSQNRRVEIVELANETALAMRAQSEAGSTKYLQYGTSTDKKPRAVATQQSAPAATSAPTQAKPVSKPSVSTSPTIATAPSVNTSTKAKVAPTVDFNGQSAESYSWTMAQNIKPKSVGFELISSARASEMPLSSCEIDKPRSSGEVLSMADDKPLVKRATTDYLPGYNNRVWAREVSGHLVTITPVSILRENAQVDRQPLLQVVKDYDVNPKGKALSIKAVANTYEGDKEILYRVFAQDSKAAVLCMDVVFSKGNATANDGVVFYQAGNETYVASMVPVLASQNK